ncbi:hypothetical protein [Streptomyces sp. SID12501]|uniref:Terpene cyclase/mutase family protein n=1 Tax=Streptomyces sp. SID12501 TaxID=2706042 RepID=A0A6B3BWR9_9ACTN|nr:hypothetical protein [Streptomyces sp. SID12501]NEC88788.1 hypothetical protein [Streptomyces sp. SID12501]
MVDPERGRLTGWSHFLEEGQAGEPPTAIGTAYGLHTVLTLGATDGRLAPSELVETLWRLRLRDGGWAARTGAGVGRPEVTALVAGVLSRAGADRGRLDEAVASLEQMLQLGEDPEGLARTYVVTTALRGLVRAAPHSPLIASLRAELLSGTLRDAEHGGLLCWGAWLGGPTGLWSAPSPSTVHTAQAVLALSRAAQVLQEDNHCRQSREQGVRWLLTAGGLDNRVEHVRRSLSPPQQGRDHAVVRHFTAAWVAKALLSTPADYLAGGADSEQRRVDRLEAAVAAVWRSQSDGVWGWEDDRYLRPIWMTYQGLSVLRSPELCGWTPPS